MKMFITCCVLCGIFVCVFKQRADWSIERASNEVQTMLSLRAQRGQGRAVGAAEDHMVCLELF